MTDAELKELKNLAEGTTPGEWQVLRMKPSPSQVHAPVLMTVHECDVRFVTACRERVSALVDELLASRAAVQRLREENAKSHGSRCWDDLSMLELARDERCVYACDDCKELSLTGWSYYKDEDV